MSRFARGSGGGDSSTLIIIIMMMMMSFIFILVGGGWFYTRSIDGGIIGVVCNDDKNAEYELDNQQKCKFVKCKDGYTADSTGMCVGGSGQDDILGGNNISVDCEIDEITPYIFGQCLNTVTGEPLTGDIDNCGTGRQRKTPNVKTVQIGSESSCPEQTHTECNVACPLECKAPDELWAPDDGASCMAGTRKLGVTVDVGGGALVTYCGEGTQIKKLDGERITSSMMGGMDLEAYKNSINFNVCTSPTSKPCKVECTNQTQPVSCPISNYDIGWLYEGGGSGKVYTKASAEGLLRGDINASQLELEPAVSRQDAIDSGAFVSATGVVNNDLIPKGYKIKFKASNEYSTAWLREQGCSIFVLEEAQAPRTSEACTWTETPGACYEVGCGLLEQQNFAYNQLLPAWGSGSCDRPTKQPANCTTRTASCCDERFVGAWTTVDGYQGCVADNGTMKRKYTRTGNGNSCSNSNVKYENDDNCGFDNDRFYIKDVEDRYVGGYSQSNRKIMGHGYWYEKASYILNGSLENTTIQSAGKYCIGFDNRINCSGDSGDDRGDFRFEMQIDGGFKIYNKGLDSYLGLGDILGREIDKTKYPDDKQNMILYLERVP